MIAKQDYSPGTSSVAKGVQNGPGTYFQPLSKSINNSNVIDSSVNSGNTVESKGTSVNNDIFSLLANDNSAYNQMAIAESQKNRDWQEYMSNTAHQREVADLKAAGLNPVLSANSGASTGSGDSADLQSNQAAYASIMTALINQQTQTQVANINAKSALDVAEQYGKNTLNNNDWKVENNMGMWSTISHAIRTVDELVSKNQNKTWKR